MSIARRSLALLAAIALIGVYAHAQATAFDKHKQDVSLAVTYAAQGSNLTSSNSFWLQGGAVELNANFFHGFGATASVLGLHTPNTSNGVPLSLITITFGPSFTYTRQHGSHALSLFAHGLIGETDGFKGTYPAPGGAISSSNSFAVQAGGGADLSLSRHLSLRLVQADYVRSQLPNSLSDVQNSFRLGAGIVLH